MPDILRHADDLEDEDSILSAARRQLEGSPPNPAIEIDVDKTAISMRRMTSLKLEDRIAYQAAVSSFADRVEARTPPSVFSARLASDARYFLKRGPEQWARWRMDALKKLVPGREWLAATDLTAYFDTISHHLLFAEIESLNVDPNVVAALREMLREWGISDGVGIPQGPNASRLLGNLFLLSVDEAMLNAGWEYSRYLDDIRIVTKSRADAVKAIRHFQRECRRRGLIVSSAKTELLHGEKAKESLASSAQLAAIDYWFHVGASGVAREDLKKLLRQALRPETNIDTQKARFSLWRLAQLREAGMIGQVLKRMEDLAPLASVVAAYLQPFMSRKKVISGLTDFLADPSRSYSDYLATWLFTAMLEHPGPMPKDWIDQAFKRVKDRNKPDYLRAVAAVVTARGERTGGISWIKREIAREHDPHVLRGFAVGLHWANQLDKGSQRKLIAHAPYLRQTIEYLQGRDRLPSLIYADRWLDLGRSRG